MSEPLSKGWIQDQLELCAKATPGPWTASCRDCSGKDDSAHWTGLGWEIAELIQPMRGQFERGQDARFIAATREGYPLVLKELLDFYASFALYSKACQVGRELFLEAHPEFGELTDPDTGEMVTWLVEQVRRRPWAECPRCGDMCLEQDMVDGLCVRCAEEKS